MNITDITLRHFRNYRECSVEFHPRVNCLVGQNAQGKTNLLEAMYAVAFGHSFRTVEYRHMIAFGEGAGRVGGTVTRAGFSDAVVVELGLERKRHLVNGKRASRIGTWTPAAVLFAPEEVLLFKEGPDARRTSLDRITAIVQPGHPATVRHYGRALLQRNRLLKEVTYPFDAAVLEPWDQELIRWGVQVVLGRAAGVAAINATLPLAYQRIAYNDPPAALQYLPCCGEIAVDATDAAEAADAIAQWFRETIHARRTEELERRVTLVGPHRDDLMAQLGGQSLRGFGSQGQHRSVVLALKVAEAELYRRRDREPPLFLLDDVTSELDPIRTAAFFRYLAATEGQVLWTTTEIPTGSTAPIDKNLRINGGTIACETI